MPPDLFFFIKIALAIWGILWFHANLEMLFLFLQKNAIGILTGIALNLQIALGSIYILTKFFQTMTTKCLSTYLGPVQFVSSMSYSFQCTDLSPLWLKHFILFLMLL